MFRVILDDIGRIFVYETCTIEKPQLYKATESYHSYYIMPSVQKALEYALEVDPCNMEISTLLQLVSQGIFECNQLMVDDMWLPEVVNNFAKGSYMLNYNETLQMHTLQFRDDIPKYCLQAIDRFNVERTYQHINNRRD